MAQSLEEYYVEDVEEPPSEPLISPQIKMDHALKYEPLQPDINETVGLITPDHWSIGSLMMCDKIDEEKEMPQGVVYTWVDEGTKYCIRKRATPRITREPEGNFHTTMVKDFGSCGGVWYLSPNVFCKVKPWTEGLTTEATTVRFINTHFPSIPTEEIMYDWIDAAWNRTVMITKRIPGTSYRDAWSSLNQKQKLSVANQVAEHCKTLATMTSDYLETVAGTGIEGSHSLRVREDFPAWRPRVEPKVLREDYLAYLKRLRFGLEPPGTGEPLVLQHIDLNPTHLFVTMPSNPDEMPEVTGIIGWGRAGYYPKFELASWSRAHQHFVLDVVPFTNDNFDWRWMFSNACVAAGFPLELEYIKDWMKWNILHFPSLSVEKFVTCDHLPLGYISTRYFL